jgi:hypothetical protein
MLYLDDQLILGYFVTIRKYVSTDPITLYIGALDMIAGHSRGGSYTYEQGESANIIYASTFDKP